MAMRLFLLPRTGKGTIEDPYRPDFGANSPRKWAQVSSRLEKDGYVAVCVDDDDAKIDAVEADGKSLSSTSVASFDEAKAQEKSLTVEVKPRG